MVKEKKNAHSQRNLSKLVDKAKNDQILAAYANSREDLARLRSKSSKNAQAFLSRPRSLATSGVPLQSLSSEEFRLAEQFHLGIDQRRGRDFCPYAHPTREPLGRLMQHAQTCKPGGDTYKVHTSLTNFLVELAGKAGVPCDREPLDLIPGSQERPADVLLRGIEGRMIAVDVTFVNTLSTTTLPRASVTAGAACASREAAKIAKYRANLSAANRNMDFIPFAVESYGSIGDGARHVMNVLIERIARREELDLGKAKERFFYELSTVIKQNVTQRIVSRQPAPVGEGGLMVRLR